MKNSEKSYDLLSLVTKGFCCHISHISACFTMQAISSTEKALSSYQVILSGKYQENRVYHRLREVNYV